MNILITGAAGFVGKNLTAALEAIRAGKDRTHPALTVGDVYLYDVDTDPALLTDYCRQADFVFHLAGVNRPKDPAEFMRGNFGFSSVLLDTLRACGNTCPVLLSSSAQATLEGRYAGSVYGESKKAGEDLFFAYGRETGGDVLVYRFPNLFGKWCRPHYNSAVATFCHLTAINQPIQVNDPTVELELVYIDDLVEELLAAAAGYPTREGDFCRVPVSHRTTLGVVADTICSFPALRAAGQVPDLGDPLTKKLYSTWLSYLPPERAVYDLKMNEDERGSFTELLHTPDRGQVSVNISRPGITKGNHWHHTKNEKFMVVQGEGLIRLRKLGEQTVTEFRVSGRRLQVVDMLPGYTHSIVNLSDTQDLVTVMWANECFDAAHPDTYFEPV